jgi:hypothetical protein
MTAPAWTIFWALGWWTTGRLFRAYRQFVYHEALEERRAPSVPRPRHHFGAYAFILLDLMFLSPVAVVVASCEGGHESHDDSEIAICLNSALWLSSLAVIFVLRAGLLLYASYHDRARAWAGPAAGVVRPLKPWKHLWTRRSLTDRAVVLGTALVAAAALVVRLGELEPAGNQERPELAAILVLLPPTALAGVLGRAVFHLRQVSRVPT